MGESKQTSRSPRGADPDLNRRQAERKQAVQFVKAQIVKDTFRQQRESQRIAKRRDSIAGIYDQMLERYSPTRDAREVDMDYSEEAVELVLHKTRAGLPLAEIYERYGEAPHPDVFRGWMAEKKEVKLAYNAAVRDSTENLRVQLMELGLTEDGLYLDEDIAGERRIFNVGEAFRRRMAEGRIKDEIKWRHPGRYGRRAIDDAEPDKTDDVKPIINADPTANIKPRNVDTDSE